MFSKMPKWAVAWLETLHKERADVFPDKSGVVLVAHATIRKHFANINKQQGSKMKNLWIQKNHIFTAVIDRFVLWFLRHEIIITSNPKFVNKKIRTRRIRED